MRNGGAVFDTNGYNVTVASALSPDPANGNATDGGLTKVGAGTLTLSGANTYTGATTINAGRVSVSSAANLGNNANPTANVVAFTGAGGELLATDNFTLGRYVTYNTGAVGTLHGDGRFILRRDSVLSRVHIVSLLFWSKTALEDVCFKSAPVPIPTSLNGPWG